MISLITVITGVDDRLLVFHIAIHISDEGQEERRRLCLPVGACRVTRSIAPLTFVVDRSIA